jgi:hypothetical protein
VIPKELVQYQNKLYYIYRKIKQTQIKEGYINEIREFWMCDVVVKSKQNNDDTLLFLREIEEAEVI